MGKPKARKPLPQFSSRQESEEFYAKYGELESWGQLMDGSTLYTLKVRDGRLLRLKFFDDGKVEELPE
jgi:hypothetical protein